MLTEARIHVPHRRGDEPRARAKYPNLRGVNATEGLTYPPLQTYQRGFYASHQLTWRRNIPSSIGFFYHLQIYLTESAGIKYPIQCGEIRNLLVVHQGM